MSMSWRKPAPKPTSSRKSKRGSNFAKQEQKQDLREWRKKNYELAEARDKGLCVFCFFSFGVERPASVHHHVYSRDRSAGGWREHYTNILCTCDEHHPPPIIFPGASKNLSWIEDVARKANEQPINSEFIHTYTGVITDA